MIKKLFWGIAALMLMGLAPEAKAATNSMYDIGYTSFAVVGVRCSTGTTSQINASRPSGFSATPAGYRILNQDSADAVWLGGVSLTTHATVTANLLTLGEKLASGSSVVYAVGKDPSRSTVPLAPIYCKAADAAGGAAVDLSVVWFGY